MYSLGSTTPRENLGPFVKTKDRTKTHLVSLSLCFATSLGCFFGLLLWVASLGCFFLLAHMKPGLPNLRSECYFHQPSPRYVPKRNPRGVETTSERAKKQKQNTPGSRRRAWWGLNTHTHTHTHTHLTHTHTHHTPEAMGFKERTDASRLLSSPSSARLGQVPDELQKALLRDVRDGLAPVLASRHSAEWPRGPVPMRPDEGSKGFWNTPYFLRKEKWDYTDYTLQK